MKKLIYILLSLTIASSAFTGCAKKDDSTPSDSQQLEASSQISADNAQSRAVSLEDIGLYYVTPASWAEYQKTNIYPRTVTSDGTVARVIYNYVKSDDLEKLNSADVTEDELNSMLTPICEITVAEIGNFNSGVLKYISDAYNASLDAATQGDYKYVIYYGAADADAKLSGDDLDVYNMLSSEDNITELADSLFTKEFNPEDVKTVAETLGVDGYITFDTKTLEGDTVKSQIFGDYDVTLVNFWGTYAQDKSNEQADLEKVYETFASDNDHKVNVINAIVDTPDETTENTAKQLKQAAGGKFTSIVMDETLATWAKENLEGVPTTVLVDNTGKIVSDQIKGAKGADYYIDVINKYLAAK